MKKQVNESRAHVDAWRARLAKRMAGMTVGQLQIAALKAFPSSPYQIAINAEINKRAVEGGAA